MTIKKTMNKKGPALTSPTTEETAISDPVPDLGATPIPDNEPVPHDDANIPAESVGSPEPIPDLSGPSGAGGEDEEGETQGGEVTMEELERQRQILLKGKTEDVTKPKPKTLADFREILREFGTLEMGDKTTVVMEWAKANLSKADYDSIYKSKKHKR